MKEGRVYSEKDKDRNAVKYNLKNKCLMGARMNKWMNFKKKEKAYVFPSVLPFSISLEALVSRTMQENSISIKGRK